MNIEQAQDTIHENRRRIWEALAILKMTRLTADTDGAPDAYDSASAALRILDQASESLEELMDLVKEVQS